MEFDKKSNLSPRFEKLVLETKSMYEKIGLVFCPALMREVRFNASGFHHLLYKSNGQARTIIERIYKLTLLPLAKAVIANSYYINEERDVWIKGEKRKIYSLVSVVGKKRPIKIRVILLQMRSGGLMFRSIMKD